MKYSQERKQAVLAKLAPPHQRTVKDVAAEEGISEATLYNWRKQARLDGGLFPDVGADPEGWTARDKFTAVIETALLNESERAEYGRKRGLYPQQITAWRTACESATDSVKSGRLHGSASPTARARKAASVKRSVKIESSLPASPGYAGLRKIKTRAPSRLRCPAPGTAWKGTNGPMTRTARSTSASSPKSTNSKSTTRKSSTTTSRPTKSASMANPSPKTSTSA